MTSNSYSSRSQLVAIAAQLRLDADDLRKEDWVDVPATMDKAAALIESVLSERAASAWIATKDRRPEGFHDILTFSKAGFVSLTHCGHVRNLWAEDGANCYLTHWMELPVAPHRQKGQPE